MSEAPQDEIERELDAMDKAIASAPTAPQGSIDWLKERIGCCTASRFKDVMNFLKSGKPSQKRIDYAEELVIERVTGQPFEHYVSGAMENGIELEPRAKMAYEARTGVMLVSCGFVHHKTIKYCGGSPDSRIGTKGGAEFKCPTPITHYETLINGMHDDHKPQVNGHIWLFDADWWDFVSYCPIFPPPLDLYIQRVMRSDDYLAELAGNVLAFLAEVDAMEQKLRAIAKESVADAATSDGPEAVLASQTSAADLAFDIATQS